MKNLVLAGLGSLVLAGAASAGFTGFAVNEYKNAAGNSVADLYMTFSSTNDVLLNVFNVNISYEDGFGAFIHNDFAGGSWGPQFGNPASNDSFVTIGGMPGFANSTNADPGWGLPGFNQNGIPNGAGWFNSNPPNLQGKAADVTTFNKLGQETYSGAAVWIGRFVVSSDAQGAGKQFSVALSYTNNQGLGTPAEQGSGEFNTKLFVIPAPGALAALGLAGLLGSRRRRA